MARYSVRAVSSACGLDPGWVGSLLTRVPIAGVTRGHRGKSRSLTLDAALCVVLVVTLTEEVGASAEAAAAVAHRLLMRPGPLPLGIGHLRLDLNLATQRAELRTALDRAVEHAVEVPRGRPPRRR